MINEKKLAKDFFNKEELNLLYELKIARNATLKEVYNKLTDYLERNNNEKYIKILEKLYKILPVYPK